jgi:hypothetical protein
MDRGLKTLVYECMSPEERERINDFGLWAFGDHFLELDHITKFMKEWNKLHGEDFLLYPTGVVDEDIVEMVQMWRHAKEN